MPKQSEIGIGREVVFEDTEHLYGFGYVDEAWLKLEPLQQGVLKPWWIEHFVEKQLFLERSYCVQILIGKRDDA